jgi:hypothetical protein
MRLVWVVLPLMAVAMLLAGDVRLAPVCYASGTSEPVPVPVIRELHPGDHHEMIGGCWDCPERGISFCI